MKTYDAGFLACLGLQYFNAGSQVMLELAYLDIFKNVFGLEPSETQNLMSYIILPWTPKLFYGILTDTFPICKSRKRSYIMLMGTLQCIAALVSAIWSNSNAYVITICGFFIYLAQAVNDVVVDGLMVS